MEIEAQHHHISVPAPEQRPTTSALTPPPSRHTGSPNRHDNDNNDDRKTGDTKEVAKVKRRLPSNNGSFLSIHYANTLLYEHNSDVRMAIVPSSYYHNVLRRLIQVALNAKYYHIG